MAVLGPVELDIFWGERLAESRNKKVCDADMVSVCAQVAERQLRREVVAVEQSQQQTRHARGWERRASLAPGAPGVDHVTPT